MDENVAPKLSLNDFVNQNKEQADPVTEAVSNDAAETEVEVAGEEVAPESQDAEPQVEREQPAKVEAESGPKASAKMKEWRALHKKDKFYREKDLHYKKVDEDLQLYKGFVDQLQKNPIQALQRLGIDYDKITDAYVNQVTKDPNYNPHLDRANQEIAQLRSTVQQLIEREQRKEDRNNLTAFQSEIKSIVSGSKNYKFLNAEGENGVLLVQEMYALAQEQDEPDTIEEIIHRAETYLRDQFRSKLDRPEIKEEFIPKIQNKDKTVDGKKQTLSNNLNSQQTDYRKNNQKKEGLLEYVMRNHK